MCWCFLFLFFRVLRFTLPISGFSLLDFFLLALLFCFCSKLYLYDLHGEWQKAAGLLEQALQAGVPLEERSFTSVIRSCARAGHLARAMEVFSTMKSHSISPHARTYHEVNEEEERLEEQEEEHCDEEKCLARDKEQWNSQR